MGSLKKAIGIHFAKHAKRAPDNLITSTITGSTLIHMWYQ